MPRKASVEPKRAGLRIEVLVANNLTYPEMREKLEKDLKDPHSGISKYLAENFNYKARPKTIEGQTRSVHGLDVRVFSLPGGSPWGEVRLEDLTEDRKDN